MSAANEGWTLFTATVLLYCLPARLRPAWSVLLGSIDHLCVAISSLHQEHFCQGLEDEEVFMEMVKAMDELEVSDLPREAIALGLWQRQGAVAVAAGTFHSPVARFLPAEGNVRTARIEVVLPATVTWEQALSEGLPVAVHLPATGDEGFALRRTFLAHALAADHKICSVILQLPFYGNRRSQGQTSSALLCLEDMARQSLAAVMEGNRILCWLREEGHCGVVGFTGISFGGSMAALASVKCAMDHFVVSHVPGNSPHDAYVMGAMRLGLHDRNIEPADRLLAHMDIARASRSIPSTKAVRRVYKQLTARHDAFIPLACSLRLFKAMSEIENMKNAKHVLLSGGHAAGIVLGRQAYLDLIVEAVRDIQQV
eukprot:gene6689-7395_t